MRRSLLHAGRRCVCRRGLSSHAATAAEVPNDPDILSTQPDALEGTTGRGGDGGDGADAVDTAQKFPRLQYRQPALGVNPAYDLALELIRQDKASTLRKMQAVKAKMTKLRASGDEAASRSKLRDLAVYHRQLQDLVDMNDPEVRWRHARGDVDLSQPIYRHLAKRTWSEKALLLLMQRVTQMSVTPDVLPLISPTVDVRLSFPGRTRGHRKGTFEVGEVLTSRDTEQAPRIEIQGFEDTERRYCLAIVDPDVPDEANDAFTSHLHYLHTDITLSPTAHALEAGNGRVLLPYVPPHPQRGTPAHRYTAVVWEMPAVGPQPNAPLSLTRGDALPRERFDAQHFGQQNGLHAVGISFWRQAWDEGVADVMSRFPEVGFRDVHFKRIKA